MPRLPAPFLNRNPTNKEQRSIFALTGAIIELDEPGEGEVERVIEHDDSSPRRNRSEIQPRNRIFLQNLKQMQEQHGYKIVGVY